MDYESLYFKLVKKIRLSINECDNLYSNPQVSHENKQKYIMTKVFLNNLLEEAGKDVLDQIIE